ncbi:hypothetical protein [Allomesorhizobium camelthorni]|uniref:Uncharacterized protein n=1 Tax=Allomesorhizobium camelthorni TaxID=475069 RepID=A0A6G4W6P1_9HYPH|nr:hypothetical protein [Mesorhizobium camelthorni]NGO50421.1 hypothetical protein [Mesorhizobium camelthorni]
MFSETIRARTRGHFVGLEALFELRFLSKTFYLHNGGGQLKSKDGQEWTGLDGAGRVSGLGASSIGNSRMVQIGLDAEDADIKTLFQDQRTEVEGRKIVVWGQFYDEDLTPLDPKFHHYTGYGDRLQMQKRGPRSRSMDLKIEDFFARRRRSAHAVVSHADQQMRDPTATGFIYQPEMVDKILNLFDARD